jgi:mannose-6-phosphate isomerase-like protein (cupin superfamily)
MRTTICSAVLLLLVSVVGLEAQRRGAATSGAVTFAVVVSDPSGSPVPDAKITLSGPAQRTTRTERGRAVFEGLPAGTYRFRFEKAGYLTFEREVVGRGGKPIDVKVTLTPEPLPPPRPVPGLPPLATAVPTRFVVLDMPAFIEKNYVGRGAGKTTPLACATGANSTLIQINEPMAEHAHSDADEFLYVIAGEGTLRMGQREEPLGPAVFLMIPRGMSHTLTAGRKKPLVLTSIRAGESCGAPAAR